ncbi:predicted protein [Lichtheimia corymbifera JMRC:FSU:9682]|uniref:Uncharacterized protein n=1 Tax=Lichtheimia corymbifera JMRC:FSU:9682 TaxID=1263082 RepID=A0A068SFA4_9FUNG|nr:predicted protein [Lichtheimia corymbifera JMRC:FSU:9682]
MAAVVEQVAAVFSMGLDHGPFLSSLLVLHLALPQYYPQYAPLGYGLQGFCPYGRPSMVALQNILLICTCVTNLFDRF